MAYLSKSFEPGHGTPNGSVFPTPIGGASKGRRKCAACSSKGFELKRELVQ